MYVNYEDAWLLEIQSVLSKPKEIEKVYITNKIIVG